MLRRLDLSIPASSGKRARDVTSDDAAPAAMGRRDTTAGSLLDSEQARHSRIRVTKWLVNK